MILEGYPVNDQKGHWGLTPLGMGRGGFLMVAPRARADAASGSATSATAALAIAGHHSGVPRFACYGRVLSADIENWTSAVFDIA